MKPIFQQNRWTTPPQAGSKPAADDSPSAECWRNLILTETKRKCQVFFKIGDETNKLY